MRLVIVVAPAIAIDSARVRVHGTAIEEPGLQFRCSSRGGEQGTPLHELVWSHRPAKHRAPRGPEDLQPTTPESVALSKALKRAGFRFVGPTTVYAAMQSCGVVNDHLVSCYVRRAVQKEIDAVTR